MGAPTDGYGRLLFLDTYNSSYGPGWLRENSFVSHGPPGMFCYGFYARNPWVGGYAHPRSTPNRKRGPGTGEQYRITVGARCHARRDVAGRRACTRTTSTTRPTSRSRQQMNAERDQIRAGYRKCAHT